MDSFIRVGLFAIVVFVTVSAERDCSDVIRSIKIRKVSDNSVKRFEKNTLKEFESFLKNNQHRKQWQLSDNVSEIYPYNCVIKDLVNYQVQQEMSAFYQYTNMAMFFHRHDKDFPGFAKYFQAGADEELKHAQMFMKFQMRRGGPLELMNLDAPPNAKWDDAVSVIDAALSLEKEVTTKILCLHDIGSMIDDKDFVDFLESNMISEQYESMRELQGHKNTLTRMAGVSNVGLAEFQFDQMLQKKQN